MLLQLNPKNVLLLGSEDIFVAISKLTAGNGVHVIVNCLRGNDMRTSIKAIGEDSRFLHLGKIKIEDKESIGKLKSCTASHSHTRPTNLNI